MQIPPAECWDLQYATFIEQVLFFLFGKKKQWEESTILSHALAQRTSVVPGVGLLTRLTAAFPLP